MALFSQLSIAPMIDWTYTHFRVLMRLLAPKALLYTDMQTPGAIFHQPKRSLFFNEIEKPLALQLGGSNKEELVRCAQMAEELGFDEVNLNLGCPSDRVQAGRFGACLMKDVTLVSECISAMKKAVSIPVTAKTRIGIDQQDSYEFFAHFARKLLEAGSDKLIVHARKAWLSGLNPKQNRSIPPVNYEFVYSIKKEFPSVPVVINGNIDNVDDVLHHLNKVDGVMLGRLACQNPYEIAWIHHVLFPETILPTRAQVFSQYIAYMKSVYEKQTSMMLLIKPILNLVHGLPHARNWKEKILLGQKIGIDYEWEESLFLLEMMENQKLLSPA